MSITYDVLVIEPGGDRHLLEGPVSHTSNFGGGGESSTIGYWPHQNGEYIFRVVRLDGPKETVVVERRVTTDKAAVLGPTTPPNTQPDGQFTVTGLRTDPVQPVVGQDVNVLIDVANFSTQPTTQVVPVLFVDDAGQELVTTGTFTLDPGRSGTVQTTWTPQHATSGILEARDRTVPLTVVDSQLATPGDGSDQVGPPDSPPDDSSDNN